MIGQTFDIGLVESSGNGGDITLQGNDLGIIYGNENQIFLALFGGNVERDEDGFPGKGWWGNQFIEDEENKFLSDTEYILNTTPLTSAGRLVIENAMKRDLRFMGKTEVSVSIVSDNKLTALIKFENQNPKLLTIGRTASGDFSILDFNDDFK